MPLIKKLSEQLKPYRYIVYEENPFQIVFLGKRFQPILSVIFLSICGIIKIITVNSRGHLLMGAGIKLIVGIGLLLSIVHILLYLFDSLYFANLGLETKNFQFKESNLTVTDIYGKTSTYHRDDLGGFEILELENQRTCLGFNHIESDQFIRLMVLPRSFNETEKMFTDIINTGIRQWDEFEESQDKLDGSIQA